MNIRRRDFCKYGLAGLIAGSSAILKPQSIIFPGPFGPATAGGFTPFSVGFDFRNTLGCVSDPSYAAAILDQNTITYPTTSTINGSSVTYGYENISGGYNITRDRDCGNDPRTAGSTLIANTQAPQIVFRVDLPHTGDYQVWSAFTDQGNNQNIWATLSDNSTVKRTIPGTVTTSTSVLDFSGASWANSAAWVAGSARGGTSVTDTYASTIMRITIGDPSAADAQFTTMAYFSLTRLT